MVGKGRIVAQPAPLFIRLEPAQGKPCPQITSARAGKKRGSNSAYLMLFLAQLLLEDLDATPLVRALGLEQRIFARPLAQRVAGRPLSHQSGCEAGSVLAHPRSGLLQKPGLHASDIGRNSQTGVPFLFALHHPICCWHWCKDKENPDEEGALGLKFLTKLILDSARSTSHVFSFTCNAFLLFPSALIWPSAVPAQPVTSTPPQCLVWRKRLPHPPPPARFHVSGLKSSGPTSGKNLTTQSLVLSRGEARVSKPGSCCAIIWWHLI